MVWWLFVNCWLLFGTLILTIGIIFYSWDILGICLLVISYWRACYITNWSVELALCHFVDWLARKFHNQQTCDMIQIPDISMNACWGWSNWKDSHLTFVGIAAQRLKRKQKKKKPYTWFWDGHWYIRLASLVICRIVDTNTRTIICR